MIVALGVAAIVALLIQSYRYGRERERLAREWREERRELLNRIQRPEYIPRVSEPVELPELTEEQIKQQRAWSQVGQVISIDDSYGLD